MNKIESLVRKVIKSLDKQEIEKFVELLKIQLKINDDNWTGYVVIKNKKAEKKPDYTLYCRSSLDELGKFHFLKYKFPIKTRAKINLSCFQIEKRLKNPVLKNIELKSYEETVKWLTNRYGENIKIENKIEIGDN